MFSDLCKRSTEEVNNVLDRVLEYLLTRTPDGTRIITLDKQYGLARQKSLNELQNQVRTELDKAQNAFGKVANSSLEYLYNPEFKKWFRKWFKNFWQGITTNLTGLLSTLKEQRDFQDNYLKKQVEELCQKCRNDQVMPSLEDIKKRRDNRGGSFDIAYKEYLNEIRTQLSQNFLFFLDDGLKHSVESAKSLVTDVLIEQGNLNRLTDTRGSNFLKEIFELIPENLSHLKLGFQLISDFDLSYRGLIQHRIRPHLDRLNPDDPNNPNLPEGNKKEEKVLENLEVVYGEAIFECEGALEGFLTEPNQAAFAMVEEFIDQVLRAKDVEEEWEEFLEQEEILAKICSEEIEPLLKNNRIRQKWLNLVDGTVAINESPDTQFLN